MPSPNQHNASNVQRPSYPDIESEYGEDPARFLWNRHGNGVPALAIARIRGIDSLDLLDEWQSVEIGIGPRRQAIAAINERRDELTADGEGERPRSDTSADGEVPA